jgi:hypothetical protein
MSRVLKSISANSADQILPDRPTPDLVADELVDAAGDQRDEGHRGGDDRREDPGVGQIQCHHEPPFHSMRIAYPSRRVPDAERSGRGSAEDPEDRCE